MLNIPKHTDIHNTTHNIVFTGLIVILLANILTSSLFEEQQNLLSLQEAFTVQLSHCTNES